MSHVFDSASISEDKPSAGQCCHTVHGPVLIRNFSYYNFHYI
jgi:hypothetical protein